MILWLLFLLEDIAIPINILINVNNNGNFNVS